MRGEFPETIAGPGVHGAGRWTIYKVALHISTVRQIRDSFTVRSVGNGSHAQQCWTHDMHNEAMLWTIHVGPPSTNHECCLGMACFSVEHLDGRSTPFYRASDTTSTHGVVVPDGGTGAVIAGKSHGAHVNVILHC